MLLNRVVEYVFFFGLIGLVGYILWQMFTPFITALALAAVIVVICYPLYEKIKLRIPYQNPSVAALLTTLAVITLVVLPILLITSALASEALAVYKILNNGQYTLAESLTQLEEFAGNMIPGLELDVVGYLGEAAKWFASNLTGILAGAASTVFALFIAIIASFYFFRDGRQFAETLIRISPLPDKEDSMILQRMVSAVRGVALGVVLVAIIQGVLSAFGFAIFGFERAVLFGTIVAITALVPGIGPSVVFIPAGVYALFIGDYVSGIGVLIWFLVAVSFLDNILGPYLVSRHHPMHPFIILLSVLGGVFMFGPIGFIIGPVITSVFIVLLEIYATHIAANDSRV